MPNPEIDLLQISTRNTHARHIVAGCASALPALAAMWQELDDALTDTVTLAAQVTRLSADLERARLDAANLRARDARHARRARRRRARPPVVPPGRAARG
jgi:outer membrane murein-binding lipoprotein Lpp